MKSITIAYCLSLSLICVSPASAQTEILKIGSVFPIERLANTTNIPLSNIKGKQLILGFWSPGCGGCYRLLKKLDDLQKQFSDVTIIPITKSSVEVVQTKFSRVKVKLPELRMIYNDSFFSSIIPHRTVPNVVWVSKKGVITYITGEEAVCDSNLTLVLQDKALNVLQKKEFLDFDDDAPLWTEGEGRFQNHLSSYSYFMDEIEDVGTHSGNITYDAENKVSGFKAVNTKLSYLYYLAAIGGKYSRLPEHNRIALDVSAADSSDLTRRLCYESWMKDASKAKVFEVLQLDLRKTFPYDFAIEKRQTKCLVLDVTVKPEGKVMEHTQKNVDAVYDFHGVKAGALIYEFENRFKLELPVLTSIDAKQKFDFKLYPPLNTIGDLNQQLKKYGLQLSEKIQELDMLVIFKQK